MLLLSRLNQLRKAGKFCDTILVAKDGTEFKLHWIVLVSRGVWWTRTAGRGEEQAEGDKRVVLPDIPASEIRRFLNEIYGGDVNVEATKPITIFVSSVQSSITPQPSCTPTAPSSLSPPASCLPCPPPSLRPPPLPSCQPSPPPSCRPSAPPSCRPSAPTSCRPQLPSCCPPQVSSPPRPPFSPPWTPSSPPSSPPWAPSSPLSPSSR